jgi:hypothetical protein
MEFFGLQNNFGINFVNNFIKFGSHLNCVHIYRFFIHFWKFVFASGTEGAKTFKTKNLLK